MNYSDSENIKAQKLLLRKKIKFELKLFSQGGKAAAESESVCRVFLQSDAYRNASAIFAYMNMPSELDVSSVIAVAFRDGKEVCIPRIVPGTNQMDFFYLDGSLPLEKQVESGGFQIREPKLSLKKVSLGEFFPENAVILVPGLLFSADGKRLGRGKGFYDRYIAAIPAEKKALLCGIGFSFQLASDIPVESHDRLLDCVICGGKMYFPRNSRL